MATQSYSEFSLHLHRRVTKDRVPVSGSIEVTRRCPLSCVHCYNNIPMQDAETRRRELTRDEHCRILDEIAEAGCFWLLFTGGEPFARPDFFEIYRHAKRLGLLITVFTNGTFITPDLADRLAEYRPFSIEITLYGSTRETYERITGVSGSFERCVRGIRLLQDRRLPLKLKTMAITLNSHELKDMKRFASEELGLGFHFDGMINCRLDCSQGPVSVRLGPREVVELDVQDPERTAEWKKFADMFNGPVHTPGTEKLLYHCGAGVSTFAVDPMGMLNICGLAHGEAYDLRQGSFREGWDDFLLGLRMQEITRETKCVNCEIKALCGMCPANAQLEMGDPETPVDYLCRVAHLRAYAFGIPVAPHGDCEYCTGGAGYADLAGWAASLRNRGVDTEGGAGLNQSCVDCLSK